MSSLLLEQAARFRQLMAERPSAREWMLVYDELVGPYELAIEELRGGDLGSIDLVLDYLGTRPTFFRSGYLAEKLMRRLGGTTLPARLKERARAAMLEIAAERSREAGQALKTLARWDREDASMVAATPTRPEATPVPLQAKELAP